MVENLKLNPHALGAEIIREQLRTMPTTPGVYRMLNAGGDALYVGKAKNLKNRVGNYVNASGLNARILTMVAQTAKMEIVTTKTEAEALLLEANLIKTLKPRYNILLRDDKSFPYILITDEPFPQITKHRGAQNRKGTYFGPFASVGAVNQTLALLQKAFLLRPCSDQIFKNRTRPCLQYQIKRCAAPCVELGRDEYPALMEQAVRFLSGKSREVQENLVKEMEVASEATEYERAARLRDRIKALTTVQQEAAFTNNIADADLFALFRRGATSCVQVFFFRHGQNYGNRSFFPAHTESDSDGAILAGAIGQFYQTSVPPKQVLTSEVVEEPELLADALSLRAGYRVEIASPLRGERKAAMDQAVKNAERALATRLAERASTSQLLGQVAEVFGLEASPARIEVYDNSHISGAHAVGAMITAGAEGFLKKHYRRFNFRTKDLAPGDDYGMLREVLTRRFSRLQKEDPDRAQQWPDLVLIDGGAAQLGVASQVFEELGVSDLVYAAISKGPDRNAGREWFHMAGRSPFQLPGGHPVLHYLQRLRDEAHRFAIGSHRIKRSNAIRQSALDEIPGIGSTRKRALLLHFGSAKAVEEAGVDELAKVEGVSRKVAEKIYGYFHA